jgi:hypothetical protein
MFVVIKYTKHINILRWIKCGISKCYYLHFCAFSEAKAAIIGLSDLYIKMGSKITLTCVISQGPHDLGTIAWYRGIIFMSNIYYHWNNHVFFSKCVLGKKKRFCENQSNST